MNLHYKFNFSKMNVKLRKYLLAAVLGLYLPLAAQAQTTAPTTTLSKTEKAEVERWRKANPKVKVVPQSKLSLYTQDEQNYFRNSSTVLISQDEALRAADIAQYERAKRQQPAYANVAQYKSAAPQPTPSRQLDAKQLEHLRTRDPQAYKAAVRANQPTPPIKDIRRDKYDKMTAAKKAQIDQNPQRYRIVD